MQLNPETRKTGKTLAGQPLFVREASDDWPRIADDIAFGDSSNFPSKDKIPFGNCHKVKPALMLHERDSMEG